MSRVLAILGGLVGIAIGVAPLVPFVAAHLADPSVRVWSDGTLVTYATEVFVEVDAVGPEATVAAWMGLTLLVVGAALPYLLVVPRQTAARWSQ